MKVIAKLDNFFVKGRDKGIVGHMKNVYYKAKEELELPEVVINQLKEGVHYIAIKAKEAVKEDKPPVKDGGLVK